LFKQFRVHQPSQMYGGETRMHSLGLLHGSRKLPLPHLPSAKRHVYPAQHSDGAEQVSPGSLQVAIGRHRFSEQRSVGVQTLQAPAPPPQAAFVLPLWHFPCASQHPVGHVDGPQGSAGSLHMEFRQSRSPQHSDDVVQFAPDGEHDASQ
jgi:hypothetical protein